MFARIINSIKAKLIILLTFLVSVLAVFLAFYLPHKFEHERFIALEDKAKTICNIAATSVISSVFFNDPEALKEDIFPVTLNKEVEFVVIVNPENKIIYNYRYKKETVDTLNMSNQYSNIHEYPVIKASKEIKINNKIIGKIYLGFSSNRIKNEMHKLKEDLLVLIFFIFISGITVSLLIAYYFMRPLKSVIWATEEVTKGNFNAQAKIFSKDEAGIFALRFNNMVLKLKSFYSQLDLMVQERTKQLQETNEKLQNEIIERVTAEEKLKTFLDEKNVMLKEIHHRVKNNMQVISSLFYLQSRKVQDKEVAQLFTESQNRILSMSLIHENLYQNNDLGKVDFNKYIQKLLNNLKGSFKDESSNVKILSEIDEITFPIDTAIPLGMIINELITNVFKHAFRPTANNHFKDGKVLKIFLKNDNGIRLEVSDNGCGLPEDFNERKTGTLGMELIKGLTRQVDGKLNIINDNGAKFILEIKTSD
jgi:two-component sensor histidine kinase